MAQWITVVPIELDYNNSELEKNREFSIGPVKLKIAPEFFKKDEIGKYLSYTQKERGAISKGHVTKKTSYLKKD